MRAKWALPVPLALLFLACATGDTPVADVQPQEGGAAPTDAAASDVSAPAVDAGLPGKDASIGATDASADSGVDSGLVVPEDSLAGEWLFDGQAKDTSGNANNGVVVGATLTADRKNRANMAYLFDGVSAEIAVTDMAPLDVTAQYAISVWVRPDGFSTLAGIVSKYQTGNAKGPTLRLSQNSPFQGVDCNEASYGVAAAQGLLTAGVWHHVVANVKGTAVEVWLDGAKAYTGTSSYTTVANTDALVIGVDFQNRYFKGAIDQVRLYTRTLTPTEIQALHSEP